MTNRWQILCAIANGYNTLPAIAVATAAHYETTRRCVAEMVADGTLQVTINRRFQPLVMRRWNAKGFTVPDFNTYRITTYEEKEYADVCEET